MEKNKFNLSDKKQNVHGLIEGQPAFYWEEDIKEFIRKLKEKIENAQEDCGNLDWISKTQAVNIIKLLSGYRLNTFKEDL